MNKNIFLRSLFLSIIIFSVFLTNHSFALNIENSSSSVLQGDTVKMEIKNLKNKEIIKSVYFSDSVDITNLFFSKNLNDKNYYALFGAGLNLDVGTKTIIVKTNLGKYNKDILVLKKEIPISSFTFSTSTATSSEDKTQSDFNKKYLSDLLSENKELGKVWSNDKIVLKNNFIRPLDNSVITDPYGYDRGLDSSTVITHKGTDYKADISTPVYSINQGIVRLTKKFSIYGNTIIIDHGHGLFSIYMHLSKIKVKQGHFVKQGQEIGLSGATGEVTGPHLHLSIKLNNQSIDPENFFETLGVK